MIRRKVWNARTFVAIIAVVALVLSQGMLPVFAEEEPEVLVNHVTKYDAATNPNGWGFVSDLKPELTYWMEDGYGNAMIQNLDNHTLFAGTMDFGEGGYTKIAVSESTLSSGYAYFKVLKDGFLEDIGFVQCNATGDWTADPKEMYGDLNELGQSLTGKQEIYIYIAGSANIRGIRFGGTNNIAQADDTYYSAENPKPTPTAPSVPSDPVPGMSIVSHASRYDRPFNQNGWAFVCNTVTQDRGTWNEDASRNDYIGGVANWTVYLGVHDFGAGGLTKMALNYTTDGNDPVVGYVYFKALVDGRLQDIGLVAPHGTGSWTDKFEEHTGELNELGKSLIGKQRIYAFFSASVNTRGVRFGDDTSIGTPDTTYYTQANPKPQPASPSILAHVTDSWTFEGAEGTRMEDNDGNPMLGSLGGKRIHVGLLDFGAGGFTKIAANFTCGNNPGENAGTLRFQVKYDGDFIDIGAVSCTGTGDWTANFEEQTGDLNANGRKLTGLKDVYIDSTAGVNLRGVRFGDETTVAVPDDTYYSAENPRPRPSIISHVSDTWTFVNQAGGAFTTDKFGNPMLGSLNGVIMKVGTLNFGTGGYTKIAANFTAGNKPDQYAGTLYFKVKVDGELKDIGFVYCMGTDSWDNNFEEQYGDLNDLGKSLTGEQEIYWELGGGINLRGIRFGDDVSIQTADDGYYSESNPKPQPSNPSIIEHVSDAWTFEGEAGKLTADKYGNPMLENIDDKTFRIGELDFGAGGFTKIAANFTSGSKPDQNAGTLYFKVKIDGELKDIGFVYCMGTDSWDSNFGDQYGDLNDLGKSLTGKQEIYLYFAGGINLRGIRLGNDVSIKTADDGYYSESNPKPQPSNPSIIEHVSDAWTFEGEAGKLTADKYGNPMLENIDDKTFRIGELDFGAGGFTKIAANFTSGSKPDQNAGTLYFKVKIDGELKDIGFVYCMGTDSWDSNFGDQYGDLNDLGKSLTGKQEIYLYFAGGINLRGIRLGNDVSIKTADDGYYSESNPKPGPASIIKHVDKTWKVDGATWTEDSYGNPFLKNVGEKNIYLGQLDFGAGGFTKAAINYTADPGQDYAGTLYIKLKQGEDLIDIGNIYCTTTGSWDSNFVEVTGDLNGAALTGLQEIVLFVGGGLNIRGVRFGDGTTIAQPDDTYYSEINPKPASSNMDVHVDDSWAFSGEAGNRGEDAFGNPVLGNLNEKTIKVGKLNFGTGGYTKIAVNFAAQTEPAGARAGIVYFKVKQNDQLVDIGYVACFDSGSWTANFKEDTGDLTGEGLSLTGMQEVYLYVGAGAVNIRGIRFGVADTITQPDDTYFSAENPKPTPGGPALNVHVSDTWTFEGEAGARMEDDYGNPMLGSMEGKTVRVGKLDFGTGGFTKVAANYAADFASNVVASVLSFKVKVDGELTEIASIECTGSGSWTQIFKETAGNLNPLGQSLRGEQEIYLNSSGTINLRGIRFGDAQSLAGKDDTYWSASNQKPDTGDHPSLIVHVNSDEDDENKWEIVDPDDLEPIDHEGWMTDPFGDDMLFNIFDKTLYIGELDFGAGGFTKIAANFSSGTNVGDNAGALYFKILKDGKLEDIGSVVCRTTGDWYNSPEDQYGDLNELGKSMTGRQKIYIFAAASVNIRGVRFGDRVSIAVWDDGYHGPSLPVPSGETVNRTPRIPGELIVMTAGRYNQASKPNGWFAASLENGEIKGLSNNSTWSVDPYGATVLGNGWDNRLIYTGKVDFGEGGYTHIGATIACGIPEGEKGGNAPDFWSLTVKALINGTLTDVGRVEVTGTGEWTKYTMTTFEMLEELTGPHDIFLYSTGTFNLSSFRFGREDNIYGEPVEPPEDKVGAGDQQYVDYMDYEYGDYKNPSVDRPDDGHNGGGDGNDDETDSTKTGVPAPSLAWPIAALSSTAALVVMARGRRRRVK